MSWINTYSEIEKRVRKAGLKLELVEWGIANRTGDRIILNKNVLKSPKYCDRIITHEIKHTSDNFTIHDLKMDMVEGELFDNILFCIKHPFGLYQFSPLIYYNHDWLFDLNLCIIYFIGLLLITTFLMLT